MAAPGAWRAATAKELASIVPARAPVESERIETELRTASGVTDGHSRYIYGVVLITAGYSAEGKYSHYFVAQRHLKVGNVDLAGGDYVFGYHRKNADTLTIGFFQASNGRPLGEVEAKRNESSRPVKSFEITVPVANQGEVRLGRFAVPYRIVP